MLKRLADYLEKLSIAFWAAGVLRDAKISGTPRKGHCRTAFLTLCLCTGIAVFLFFGNVL